MDVLGRVLGVGLCFAALFAAVIATIYGLAYLP